MNEAGMNEAGMNEAGMNEAGMNESIKRIAVYCGSSNAVDPSYFKLATSFGEELARRNKGVVFGGGDVGMMGKVADAALAGGAEVIGVIPKRLERAEVAHQGLSELHIVEGMHPRKLKMMELADAFVALPGGYGTLEELFEAATWLQIGYHQKPCGILNVNGFFDHLLAFIEHAGKEGFVRPQHWGMIHVAEDAGELLDKLEAEQPQVGLF